MVSDMGSTISLQNSHVFLISSVSSVTVVCNEALIFDKIFNVDPSLQQGLCPC